MKILVGYDGSQHAKNALNAALALAEKFSASITVLSVMKTIPWSWRHSELERQYHDQRQIRYERMLSTAIRSATKRKPHVTITCTIVQGDPARMILEKAHTEGFDLIVVGSRGLGSLQELFLGSVSHSVVNNASCAVLIVK